MHTYRYCSWKSSLLFANKSMSLCMRSFIVAGLERKLGSVELSDKLSESAILVGFVVVHTVNLLSREPSPHTDAVPLISTVNGAAQQDMLCTPN